MESKTNSGIFHSSSWQLLVGEITWTPSREAQSRHSFYRHTYKKSVCFAVSFPRTVWEMFVLVSKQITKLRPWRFPNGTTKFVGDINVWFIFLVNSYYFFVLEKYLDKKTAMLQCFFSVVLIPDTFSIWIRRHERKSARTIKISK